MVVLNPNELFLVTHMKKDNACVNSHAHETYVGCR